MAGNPFTTMNSRSAAPVKNFGGNVNFVPEYLYAPATEDEVLALLDRHSRGRIRVVGSLHSWSDVAESEEVLLDLRHLNQVEISSSPDGAVTVTAGSGCTIQRLLDALHQQSKATLPTVGVITRQTIAGAISTGTHGSGKPSLSHYASEIRVAAYDPDSGRARVYRWDSGDKLRAARCAVGCMGVILSVKLRCVPSYHVEEVVVQRNTLEEVIAAQDRFPLQQFVLLPYCWQYLAYQRRVALPKTTLAYAIAVRWARVSRLLIADFSLHLLLKGVLMLASARRGSSRMIGWFYRVLLPGLMASQKRKITDHSENILTMRHDMFRHLEMEIFVPSGNLTSVVKMIQSVVSVFAGFSDDVPEDVAEQLRSIEKLNELEQRKGDYTHHYPLFFRHVLQDDTMISMVSGDQESYYSISFFTYLPPESREHFYRFARFMALCLTRLFQGRLHWGKYFPLDFSEIEHQYAGLEKFRGMCRRVDANGVFQNDYARRVLGFKNNRPGE
jgi:hypothetical protein